MSARQLVGLVALGGLGWALWRRSGGNMPATALRPPTAALAPPATPSGYDASTRSRESGGDPYAKNPRSSASGLYQFTRDTWLKLGGQWGADPSKPFGGLRPSAAEQQSRFDKLTGQNAAALRRAGLAVTNGTLYAAHFLGSGKAVRVLTAPPSTSLAAVVGSRVMRANPHLQGFTVGQFIRWVEAKA